MLANPLVEAVLIGVADQFTCLWPQGDRVAGKHVLVENRSG
jgi:hypothetical protein